MGKRWNNKWIRAAIPALLIHCSIGTVYCWSLLKEAIAQEIGSTKTEVEWAFSIAIFVLGMSAAFAGRTVEKDIHKSSLISALMFVIGFAGTGVCIQYRSLIGIYIFYGCIMGIGLGVGYLTPVKTLMLWFSEQKGLATGLAVAGFGLAKVIASPIMTALIGAVGIVKMFYILAAVYFVMMMLGHLLLKKPDDWTEDKASGGVSVLQIISNPVFIGIWLMFYINITCGLALIAQEKDMLSAMGVSLVTISMVSSLTAVFNAGGRVVLSAAADRMKDRNTVYKLIFVFSIAGSVICFISDAVDHKLTVLIILLLCVINAGYGGGFSNLPTLLSDRFGMKNISQIHGLSLSAWAAAGLTGNQLSAFLVETTGSFDYVLLITAVLYTAALFISFLFVKKTKTIS